MCRDDPSEKIKLRRLCDVWSALKFVGEMVKKKVECARSLLSIFPTKIFQLGLILTSLKISYIIRLAPDLQVNFMFFLFAAAKRSRLVSNREHL